jgi:2-polyprenyl-3-methyl-5-hydroxy-6-metoxy-1,4-benzoquinol methylase
MSVRPRVRVVQMEGHLREDYVSQDFNRGFRDVSRSRDVYFFLQFLDSADALETMQSGKRRMLEIHPITEGAHILDVGCGIGHELQIHRAARVPHRPGSEPSAT